MKTIVSVLILSLFVLLLSTIFNSDNTAQADVEYQLVGTATVTLTSTPRPMITFSTNTPTVTFANKGYLPVILKNR